jgi:hypothetical protein
MKKMKILEIIVICSAIIISLCVESKKFYGLEISIDAPQEVLKNQEFTVFLDLKNNGTKSYNIEAEFFDVGLFTKKGECKKKFELKPRFEQSLECKLIYDKELEKEIPQTIYASVIYSSDFSIIKEIVFMTQEEYEGRRITGRLETLPRTFVENNNDLEILIEITENPIIVRDVEQYLYLTIRNVGNGIVKDIENPEINILPNIPIECDVPKKMYVERTGERIACKINAKNIEKSYLNAYAIINIKYKYQLKSSAEIIVR